MAPRASSAPTKGHSGRTGAGTGVIRIGTQGWSYPAWLGPFYPPDTRSSDFLNIYARAFDTVEVDATLYAAPSVSTFRGWANQVPEGFAFALKMPQEVTHDLRLRDADAAAGEFFERIRALGSQLGPVLMQFAPDFGPSELPALAAFLPTIPKDVRVAVEFRHKGWVHDGVLALLAEHNVAFVQTDARFIPRRVSLSLADRPTADFAYLRWVGPDRDLVDHSRLQVDRSREIELWAEAIERLTSRVGTVFGYVSNYFAGHAPASARMMQQRLGITPIPPERLGDQLLLF
jgi:uncharacterized protein YecE (DUF72 family)